MLAIGTQDKIKLSTLNGKTGYRIKKVEIINKTTGAVAPELVFKIFKTDQTGAIAAAVDFSEGDLLAMVYYTSFTAGGANTSAIIFDNEVFNQDIFVSVTDAAGGTDPCNYYIELETMTITDIQSTQLTLQSLRNIHSR